jgi:hypothetical protein
MAEYVLFFVKARGWGEKRGRNRSEGRHCVERAEMGGEEAVVLEERRKEKKRRRQEAPFQKKRGSTVASQLKKSERPDGHQSQSRSGDKNIFSLRRL